MNRPPPSLRMRLEQILESHGHRRWMDETSQLRITRDQFLDLVSDLIGKDTEIRARQLDVETMFDRRREGAAWAILAMEKAGLLNKEGVALLQEWKARRLENLPDLSVGTIAIIPPEVP